jgi:hypothetical protein
MLNLVHLVLLVPLLWTLPVVAALDDDGGQ